MQFSSMLKLPWRDKFSEGKKLVEEVKTLGLPAEDFVVFGSGAMYTNKIKDLDNDIDIVARGAAWEKATKLSDPVDSPYDKGEAVFLKGGKIEIFNEWLPGEWNVNKLIDEAKAYDGIKFVDLETLIRWKKMMDRPKDREHLKLIEKHKFQKRL